MKSNKNFSNLPIARIIAEALGLGRYDSEGKPISTTRRAYKVGQTMADKEKANPKSAPKHKARRARLKKAGFASVSAGMASRSKEIRAEEEK